MKKESPNNLPPEVALLRDEVEGLAGVEVKWIRKPKLEGVMSAKWSVEGPVISYKQYSHAGAAHELLHLMLDLKGFKRPHSIRAGGYLSDVVTLLHNVLQHAVIYPRLRSLGLCDDAPEYIAAHSWFQRLRTEYSVAQICAQPGGTALLALLYLRASYHCPAEIFRTEFQAVFKEPQYAEVLDMATLVHSEISLDESSPAEHFNRVLTQCIEALGLADDVVVVDPINVADD